MYSNDEMQRAIDLGQSLVLFVTCKGDYQTLFIQPKKES